MRLSPCIEWHFADEHADMADRIRAAKAAGYDHAEFHLWRDKPVDSIAAALDETGVQLTGLCVDPRRSLVDPDQHGEFLDAVRDTIAVAQRLGSPPLVVASGFVRDGVSAEEHFAAAVSALKQAAALAEAAGITIVLEPLNDRIDHPGMYLVSTVLGLDLIEAVDSPNLRLLYDAYHSSVMGEEMTEVLAGRMHLVHHVQLADYPGRNEPGTGEIDWPAKMRAFAELGYTGRFGLEYRPTMPTGRSLAQSRSLLGF